MSNLSNGLFKLRFSKTSKQDSYDLYSMSMEMRRLFLAIDETKIVSQVASQLKMELSFVRNGVIELLKKELIQPAGHFKLCTDHNFSKLLKINLHYILGRKAIAYTCVDKELKNMNLSHDQVPVDLIEDVVVAVSSIISNSSVRSKFCEYMKITLPLRIQIKKITGWDNNKMIKDVPAVTRGKTKKIIDRIIAVRSGGDPSIENNIKTKLVLKGINPNKYSGNTVDDPKTIAQLRKMANAMGVDITVTRGRIRKIIERIVEVRSGGDPTIENNIKTKLALKGINPFKYSRETLDDPKIIARLHKMAAAMGINLNSTRGKAKQIIDRIIAVRSGGDPTIEKDIQIKLMFKGINPDKYSRDTLDDPKTIARLFNMANAMGVDLNPRSIPKDVIGYSEYLQ